MSKLLTLLGQSKYDKLKELLGDGFEAYEKQYEDGEITDEDVNAKVTELGITDDVAGAEDTTGEEPTAEDTTGREPTNEEPEGTGNGVLLDGWLLENGEVNYDSIIDATLRDYIKGLNERLKRSEWEYKYKTAIMIEAMKSNMCNVSDAEKFIQIEELTIDDNGNVIGVKEAFEKLKADRPYLFKPAVTGSKNPVDVGFDPVDHKATGKPGSYAEALELSRAKGQI